MARADLICELVKKGLENDNSKRDFRKVVVALQADEASKKHSTLASKIEELLKVKKEQSLFMLDTRYECLLTAINPAKRLDQLQLSQGIVKIVQDLSKEYEKKDLLKLYELEPRNKVLLIGPPGNGKTSLAEVIANILGLPLFVVRPEEVIASRLGETGRNLAKVFECVRTRPCVLFFDEFETLAKERDNRENDMGEMQRVVSTLLLQIDALPNDTVVVCATNHDNMLDKAVWRRFQIKVELTKPTLADLEKWFENFESKWKDFSFGVPYSVLAEKVENKSYAEAEELALSILRKFVLELPNGNPKEITERQLALLAVQAEQKVEQEVV
jgi:SpoVK/Ycf46/Vps4 family AAA+-type ATPase